MTQVFVLDTNKQPKNPVHPAQARLLLTQNKASVFRYKPFTIILKTTTTEQTKTLRLKLDPGAKTTGIALVDDNSGSVVFAAELQHRGFLIKKALESRRSLRRGRRNRKTRYRKPRFLNRKRADKWLAPSLMSRVHNIMTWVNRLSKLAPISSFSQELVRFDTQKINNPEISGTEYQQGELHGYEVREYLLEKWGRKCAYCGATDTRLEVEHIKPKSLGGSDRISNLSIACRPCNQKKGNQELQDFLKRKPDIIKRVLAQAKRPLADAAAVNTTRWYLYNALKSLGLPVEVGSGGLTKYNRSKRSLDKTHWLDAACVGASTPETLHTKNVKVLYIFAKGHGNRKRAKTDKHGFPETHKQGLKHHVYNDIAWQTGDIGKAIIPKGKNKGVHVGRITIRAKPSFKVSSADGVHPKYIVKKLQCVDGYDYSFTKPSPSKSNNKKVSDH